jgi:ATP-dependent DNA helicase RecQ
MFLVDREELYKVQIAHPDLDLVIKTLLRANGGIFSQYVNISEDLIVRATNLSSNGVYEALKKLSQQKIISFLPRKKTPMLTFTEDRLDDKNLRISPENYSERKERYVQRVSAVLDYATSVTKCRSQHLTAYFGEKDGYRCGQCDVCTERNELNLSKYEFDLILSKLKLLLMESSYTINDLIDKSNQDADKSVKVVRWLLDNGKIKQDGKGLLSWA